MGGLVEHTVAVGTLVGEVCQLHPRLDSDLLMAAALLHDVGKAREFTYGAEFGITEEGRLLGHLALGAEIVGSAAALSPIVAPGCCTAFSPTTAPREGAGGRVDGVSPPRRRSPSTG